MDQATEMAVKAIVRGIVEAAPDISLPDAITQSLYRMVDDLTAASMPAEAYDVNKIADAARDSRNARLQNAPLSN